MVPLAYFDNRQSAIAVRRDNRFSQFSVMGYFRPPQEQDLLWEIKEYPLLSGSEEFWRRIHQDEKAKALAKLTTKEKRLLGLIDAK